MQIAVVAQEDLNERLRRVAESLHHLQDLPLVLEGAVFALQHSQEDGGDEHLDLRLEMRLKSRKSNQIKSSRGSSSANQHDSHVSTQSSPSNTFSKSRKSSSLRGTFPLDSRDTPQYAHHAQLTQHTTKASTPPWTLRHTACANRQMMLPRHQSLLQLSSISTEATRKRHGP